MKKEFSIEMFSFNNFFSKVGANLNKKFTNETDFGKYMKFNSMSSIYLNPVIPKEVSVEMKNLKINLVALMTYRREY